MLSFNHCFFTKNVFHWRFLITYIFSSYLRIAASRACYIPGQWSDLTIKNTTLLIFTFLAFFYLFFIKKIFIIFHVFIIFVLFYLFLFFWWSIEFPQQNINQSETRIGDMKFSVELYVKIKVCVRYFSLF